MLKNRVFFLISVCMMSLLFSSCNNWRRAVSSKIVHQPEKPIDNMMLVFTEYQGEISGWNEDTYDKAVKDKFNNLEYERFRNHLNDVGWDIFLPLVSHDFRKVFENHNEYTFNDFQEKTKAVEVDYVLLINMKINEPRGEVIRRIFQVYLIDTQTGTHIWSGYGYHNPGNIIRKGTAKRLLKGIKRDLVEERMIVS